MKKTLRKLILFTAVLLLLQCKNINKTENTISVARVENSNGKEEEEDQDGIREAQEMEFEMTKDISLGYVPKDRLVSAYEKLMADRKNSPLGTEGVSALTWSERGPNTDFIGPSNGNLRGTQSATDAVTSGRMRAVWVDIADATVWVGSVSGGLWHSTNISSSSSAVWSLVNDFFGNLAISSICQDPTNTNIMYFGTGEKAFNADAVRGGGVWQSTDHGLTWNLMPGTSSYYNVSKVCCDAAGNLYVGTIAGGTGGVQRYNKVSSTWDNISPAGLSARITEMRISTTGRLHVVCGYYNTAPASSGCRYTDNPSTVTSATWTAPTTAIPNTLTPYNVELAVAGNTLYAECSNSSFLVGAVYKSTDGGVTWAAVTTPPGNIMTGAQAWYDLAIGCDPNNPNIVIAGGLNFYRSTDGGTTWNQITEWAGNIMNYVHADHHAVVWNTNGSGAGTQVLVASDGGLFYSTNNGVSFVDRNDGMRMKQFYSCAIHPSSTNYFLAGAQDNGTHQLNNAGLGGSTEVIGGDGSFTHIDQDEPQYQFSGFTGTSLIRSTNSGANWSSLGSYGAGQFINPSDYDDVYNRMYLASSSANLFYRWNDPQTGFTFSSVTATAFNGGAASTVTVSPYTPNRVFFGTSTGRVVRVDNANAAAPTITHISSSAAMSATTVSCVAAGTNDNNLIATFSNYGSIHIWATTDGGTTWSNISGNIPDIPVRWAMFYPEDNTKAIIATELGIYETTLINGASTIWTANASYPTVKTTMLQYRKSDGMVLASSYGRGLWTAPIPFTNPYVRFAFNGNSKTELTTASTATCRNYTDYTVDMNIDQAPAGNANVTLSVAGGSTATQGVDFDFTTNGSFTTPSNTLTFLNGTTTAQTVTIRVYNDAETENEEFLTLNYSIGGGTNALAAPSSPSYTFTITDNDVAPITPFSATNFAVGTYSNNLTGQSPFQANLSKYRIQLLYTKAELNASGITGASNITAMNMRVVTKNSTSAYNGFTISMANAAVSALASNYISGGFTQVFTGNYSSAVGDNNFTFSTPFAWDGNSNVVVQVCYDNVTAPGPSADVMEGTAAPLGTGIRASIYSSSVVGTGCSLGAAFISDARIRAIFSASGGSPVESTLSSNKTEYIPGSGNHYFYNGANVLAGITAVSANLGCVTSNVFEAGNTWQIFEAGFRSQKVIEITPTTNSGATYTVSLYYTAAELTGQVPANLKIAKTNAATMAAANAGNTVTATTNVTAYGTGFIYTATFTGFSKFFLINAGVALPVTLVSFSGAINTQDNAALQWKVSNEVNLKSYEIERSYDGLQFTTAGTIAAGAGGSLVKDYAFIDAVTVKPVNYYRLKMIDNNGRFRYSDIIILKSSDGSDFVQILKNPVSTNISLSVNNKNKEKITMHLFSTAGQLINKWEFASADGTVLLPFTKPVAGGMYVLRVTMGSKQAVIRIVKE